jgi:pimeloyl-ACP methyl ester carboxylesterase
MRTALGVSVGGLLARVAARSPDRVTAAMVLVNAIIAALSPADRRVILAQLERIAATHQPPTLWFQAGRNN